MAARQGSDRRRARVVTMQALYRAEVAGDPPLDLAREVSAEERLPEEVRAYSAKLLGLVAEHREEIDRVLAGALEKWDLKRVAVVDRCVLRIGAGEILFEPDLPVQVILNEAIEIAKQFASEESGRFVNGVLDRIARDHRKDSV